MPTSIPTSASSAPTESSKAFSSSETSSTPESTLPSVADMSVEDLTTLYCRCGDHGNGDSTWRMSTYPETGMSVVTGEDSISAVARESNPTPFTDTTPIEHCPKAPKSPTSRSLRSSLPSTADTHSPTLQNTLQNDSTPSSTYSSEASMSSATVCIDSGGPAEEPISADDEDEIEVHGPGLCDCDPHRVDSTDTSSSILADLREIKRELEIIREDMRKLSRKLDRIIKTMDGISDTLGESAETLEGKKTVEEGTNTV